MMQDDSKAILDDILSRWHSWAKGYSPVPVCGADPMFRNNKSPNQWDTVDEVIDEQITSKIMQAVDFQVGEMKDPYRSSIYILARNCATGRNVWLSPRLPKELMARTAIVQEARSQLTRRLMNVGVM